jgi:hypothetical protein
MELIETDALAAGGGKKANRNRNEAEGNVAFPDCRSHDACSSLETLRLSRNYKGIKQPFAKQENWVSK